MNTSTYTVTDYKAEADAAANKAMALNGHLSPTARELVGASAARDVAMQWAYDAEGTDREAEADAAYATADRLYRNAQRRHRAAREASEND